MIRLYTWSTPNGVKISIALEELGLDLTQPGDERLVLKVAPLRCLQLAVHVLGQSGEDLLALSGVVVVAIARRKPRSRARLISSRTPGRNSSSPLLTIRV